MAKKHSGTKSGGTKRAMTYKKAGVDISLGDACSRIAYAAAKTTFKGRTGIGKPINVEGGFTGALDMGAFLMVQNEDTVGTKAMVAEMVGDYSTLGYDLVAMVADDAICVGAEVVSITNTVMARKLDKKIIEAMMKGMARACLEQRIVIPGGEIANVEQVSGYEWGATAIGIVERDKFITGSRVRHGDAVIGIREHGLRSNGFTLARRILEQAYGKKWASRKYGSTTWGKALLQPSRIYHAALLELLGRFGKKRKIGVKALAHVTGGGIHENLKRVTGAYTADLNSLPEPPKIMRDLMALGGVSHAEAYRTWNMGVGMILVVDKKDAEKTIAALKQQRLEALIIGVILAA